MTLALKDSDRGVEECTSSFQSARNNLTEAISQMKERGFLFDTHLVFYIKTRYAEGFKDSATNNSYQMLRRRCHHLDSVIDEYLDFLQQTCPLLISLVSQAEKPYSGPFKPKYFYGDKAPFIIGGFQESSILDIFEKEYLFYVDMQNARRVTCDGISGALNMGN